MHTYLICDPVSKKFYVGSGKKKSRPLRHLRGKSCNNHLANITAKRNVFIFVSDDDGLETRDEEQFYLDFYFNSPWCLNNSGSASGGDGHGAFARYNKTEKAKEDRRKRGPSIRKGHAKSTHKHQGFKDPEMHRQRISESHKVRKQKDPNYSDKMRRAQRACVLSKVGFEGIYPHKREFRTALSSDFENYFAHYGQWQ